MVYLDNYISSGHWTTSLFSLMLYSLATWLHAQSHLLLSTHGGFRGRCFGWVSHVYCINLVTISRRRLLPQASSQTKNGATTPARFYAWTGSGEAWPGGGFNRSLHIVAVRASSRGDCPVESITHLVELCLKCGEHSATRPVLGSHFVVSSRGLSESHLPSPDA